MVNKAHSLERDELVRVLTVYSGVTSSDGAEDGSTLIDSALVGENDFIKGKTILLLSNDARYEDKGAVSFDPDTGTITLESEVSAQIVAGTLFRILNISSVETLIKDLTKGLISFSGTTTSDGGALGSSLICSDLEDEADFDGNQVVIATGDYKGQARDINGETTGGIVTPHLNFGGVIVEGTEFIITAMRVVPAEVAALETKVGEMNAAATSDDMTDITTTSVFAKLRLLLNRMSSDAFTATIQGAARTELDTMLAQLATYFSASGAAMSIQVNNQTARTNLEQALEDFFAVIGCEGTSIFDPSIGGSDRTTFDAAFEALAAILGNPARDIDTILGTRWDAAGDLGTDIAGLFADVEKIYGEADGGTNAYPDSVAQDSIIAYILSKADPAVTTSYNNTTDSLEAIRDKIDAVQGGTETLESLMGELLAILDAAANPDTQALTGPDTEDELYNKTDTNPFFVAGVWLGMEDMAAGDVVRFRAYRDWDDASILDMVSDDETWTFGGVQTPKWAYFPLNIYCTYEFKVTAERLDGTVATVYADISDAARGG